MRLMETYQNVREVRQFSIAVYPDNHSTSVQDFAGLKKCGHARAWVSRMIRVTDQPDQEF